MMRAALLAPSALLAVFVVACDSAPTAVIGAHAVTAGRAALVVQASAGPSASGSGTVFFGASVERISFHAQGEGLTATGQAEFHNKTAGVKGKIDIDCMVVEENTARLSGIVTESSDPSFEGQQALFQVQDNGEGKTATGPDQMSLINFFDVGVGPNCIPPSEFDMVPITHGNVQVRP